MKIKFLFVSFASISRSSLFRIHWSFSRVPLWNSVRIPIKWGTIVTTLIFGEAFLAIIKKIKAQYSFLILSHIESLENIPLFPSYI